MVQPVGSPIRLLSMLVTDPAQSGPAPPAVLWARSVFCIITVAPLFVEIPPPTPPGPQAGLLLTAALSAMVLLVRLTVPGPSGEVGANPVALKIAPPSPPPHSVLPEMLRANVLLRMMTPPAVLEIPPPTPSPAVLLTMALLTMVNAPSTFEMPPPA